MAHDGFRKTYYKQMDWYQEEMAGEPITISEGFDPRPRCKFCGKKMRRIKGRYGDFYGCPNYIKTGCKYTIKINGKKDN
jgi:hypothetical protein